MGSSVKSKKQNKITKRKLSKNIKQFAKMLKKYKVAVSKRAKQTDCSSSSCSGSCTREENTMRAYDGEINTSCWNEFVKVRENAFDSLQYLINENWNQNSSVKLTRQEILDLSLLVEQRSLLTCMQTHVYQMTIFQEMSDIKESSSNKKLHPLLQKLVVSIWERHKNSDIKVEGSATTTTATQTDTAIKLEKEAAINKVREEKVEEANVPHQGLPIPVISTVSSTPFPPLPPERDVIPIITKNILEPLKNISNPFPLEETLNVFQQSSMCRNPPPLLEDNLDDASGDRFEVIPLPEMNSSAMPVENHEMEDVTSTTNDHFLGDTRGHDPEIDHLMRILEGEDDDDFKTSRCDLDTRVEQMQSFFNDVPDIVSDRKPSSDGVRCGKMFRYDLSGKHGPKMWAVERYIFMYRINAKTSIMNDGLLRTVKDQFLKLFGVDSDDENEDEFSDYDKFTNNCVRRVLPTVAKYLMPYYNKGRICHGSFVFKNLVRRVAESLIDQNYYPNDLEIRQFVDRFFPDKQKFLNIGDVWSFTLDDF